VSSVFPAESAVGTANFAGSEVESIKIKLAAAGPIPTAVLYNNAKDLVKALVVLGTLGLVPTGTISAFAGTTLPSGYLWCDGAAQLKASYPDLYLILGASRYAADTATQFYTPDLTSHLPRGAAATSGVVTTNNNNTHGHASNASFTGATTLTYDSGAAHIHGVNSGTTNNDGAHGHNMGGPSANANRGATGALLVVATVNHAHSTGSGEHNHALNGANTGNANANHTHQFLPTGNVTVAVTDNTTYVPAFVEVNYIIKT
jgi:microcystin-dependent protein